MDFSCETFINIKSILVTGGCGFIGSNFLNICVKQFPNILFCNIDKMDYCSSQENLTIKQYKNYKFYECDISNYEYVKYILEFNNIDLVVNFAAHSFVDASFDNPISFTTNNVLGTHIFLETCRKYGKIQKFIHMSTDEVYGDNNEEILIFDEKSLLNPTNPYSASKGCCDLILNSYKYTYKFPVIIVRCNNVYGLNQYPEKVIPKFIKYLKNKRKITIHGNGYMLRSFIHVYDVINAIIIIMNDGIVGEIYNIGSKNEYSILQLAELLIQIIYNNNLIYDYIEFIDDRLYNDKCYNIDYSKLVKMGWKENFDFYTSLIELVNVTF